MNWGRVWSCDRFQLRVAASVSLGGVITPADGAGAMLATAWTPNQTGTLPGFVLTAGRTGVQPRYIRLTIPALNVDTGRIDGGAGNGSIEALLEIDGLAVHLGGGDPPLWRVSWTAMRLFRDGVQVWTLGSGSYSDANTCGRIAPAGVPLLGIPATLSADAQALMPEQPNCSVQPGDPTIYAGAGPHTVTAEGGWRFREAPASPWVELPVSLTMISPPAPSGCACPTPTLLFPSATTTWNGQVSAQIGGTGGTTFQGYRRTCSVTLLPDLPKSFELATGRDYAALWLRGGLPRTLHKGEVIAQACSGYLQPNDDCSSAQNTEQHPAASEFLGVVVWEDDPADPGGRIERPIEDVLAQPTKAPYKLESLVYTAGPWPSDCSVLRRGQFPALESKTNAFPKLRHADDVACYIDTWANPHWSFFYWFPPPPADQNDPLQEWEWPVDGTRVSSDLYWVPLRTQWLHHPALPESEKRRSRTSLVSAPLWENALRQEIARSYIAAPTTSWVGVCRFEPWMPVFPALRTLGSSSAPAWSSTNATLSFGANVTVGYVAAGDRIVEIDLGRFGEDPRFYPPLATSVGFYWPAAQVQNVKIEAVYEDGSAAQMHSGQLPPPSSLPFAAADPAKYAGSWAQDFGLGGVTDSPADTQPDGDSATHMASAELSTGWRLGPARSPAKLRLTITPAAPGTGTVTLSYPVFYRPTTTASVLSENGHQQLIVWPDRASWRFGQQIWLDDATNQPRSVPLVADGPGSAYVGQGYKASALDALCEGRLRLEARAATADLDSQIESLWDAIERSGRPTAAKAADELTLAWVHASGASTPVIALCNTWREVPPLAAFPRRKRDAASLAETGGFVQASYDWAWEPRVLALPSGFHPALKATDTSGDVLTARTPAVSGWDLRQHAIAVDNTETNWGVYLGGRKVAEVRPWHGWSFSPREIAATLRPAYAVDATLAHLLLGWDGSAASRSWTPNAALPLLEPSVATPAPSAEGGWALAFLGRRAVLAASDGSTVRAAVSSDYGGSWTVTALGIGKNPAVVCCPDGTTFVYYVRSGSVYVRAADATLGTWSPEQACGPSGLDDAPIDAGFSPSPGGGRRIVLVGTVGGELRQWTSTDGVAYS